MFQNRGKQLNIRILPLKYLNINVHPYSEECLEHWKHIHPNPVYQ